MPTYSVWAHCAYGWQCRCQKDLVSLLQSAEGEAKLASPSADWRRQPASCGSTPTNRIWDTTTLHSPKENIWLRTAFCGRWCCCMAIHNPRVACQKRRRCCCCFFIMLQISETACREWMWVGYLRLPLVAHFHSMPQPHHLSCSWGAFA